MEYAVEYAVEYTEEDEVPCRQPKVQWMLPGAEMVVGVDAVVALMGVVYCGHDGYLVRRDSCFRHDIGWIKD